MSESKKKHTNVLLTVPTLPLRDVIIFPHMVVPLFVGREKSINALEQCVQDKKDLFLVAQKEASVVNPKGEDIFSVGTLGTILQILRLPDNTVKVLVEGKSRARIKNYRETEVMVESDVELIEQIKEGGVETEALIRSIKATFENYVKLNKRIPPEMLISVNSIDDPARMADLIVAHLNLKLADKQKILETFEPSKRLSKLLELMQGEIEILRVEKKIRTRVKKQMERSQKEYYLNEQITAIQKELGENDEFKEEIKEIESKIKSLKLSKEANEKVHREIKKLKMMSPMSAEATVVRNYIDWIVSLPWGVVTKDSNNLEKAQEVLDKDHYGLEDVKERILEYLAVKALAAHQKGQILCLLGPPGVGKTSLANSIAKSLNKKFVRCSLGGVRDEAEIRGHRRTYVGALPGKIIQSLKKCGSSNPVFLFDEIDKMSTDFRGDPSSALLEALDPEQNINFGDHYLEVDFDLSKVMFVLTANSIQGIPNPLLDRMEVIRISGYTEVEKFNIAKKYLLPKQIKENGLDSIEFNLADETVNVLMRNYTKEAGVRGLDRELAKVCRKVARKVLSKRTEAKTKKKKEATIKIKVKPENLEKMLGPKKFHAGKTEKKNEVGLVNGLAYTEVGGDLLQIEVSVLPGKGQVKVTGKLGEVMQESAAAAMTYVRSRAHLLGLEKDFYQKIDIHLHVPEGAVPKDGPSAGVTMATAIMSALTKVPVRKDVAMTGEITLRGRVLKIGGLKEKLLAAKLAEIKKVIIPMENTSDLIQIPKEIIGDMEITPVDHADQVVRAALDLARPSEFLVVKEDEDLTVTVLPASKLAKRTTKRPVRSVRH